MYLDCEVQVQLSFDLQWKKEYNVGVFVPKYVERNTDGSKKRLRLREAERVKIGKGLPVKEGIHQINIYLKTKIFASMRPHLKPKESCQRANKFLGGLNGLKREELIKNTHWRVLFIRGISSTVSNLIHKSTIQNRFDSYKTLQNS